MTHWTLATHPRRDVNSVDDHSRCASHRASRSPAPRRRRVFSAAIAHTATRIRAHRQRLHLHRQNRGGKVVMETLARNARHHLQALQPLPPANLRQGRTLPPDTQEIPAKQDAARPLTELQAHLDRFVTYYNANNRTRARSTHTTRRLQHKPKAPAPPPTTHTRAPRQVDKHARSHSAQQPPHHIKAPVSKPPVVSSSPTATPNHQPEQNSSATSPSTQHDTTPNPPISRTDTASRAE